LFIDEVDLQLAEAAMNAPAYMSHYMQDL